MRRTWTRLRALAPVAQGFLGALLCAVLIGSGLWLYREWTTWTVVKQVVAQIIENSNRERARQTSKADPAEKP